VRLLVYTSALYTLLDEDELNHRVAQLTFDRALERDDVLMTHNYVVTEACAVAQRRLGADAAIDLLKRLIALVDITWIDRDVHDAAVSAFVTAGSRSVSLVDRVSFEVMRRERIDTAFAFDDDFGRAGFRTVP
jgi:predicted nucleic acid-binding protein